MMFGAMFPMFPPLGCIANGGDSVPFRVGRCPGEFEVQRYGVLCAEIDFGYGFACYFFSLSLRQGREG